MQQPEDGAIALSKAEDIIAAEIEKRTDRIDDASDDKPADSQKPTSKSILSIDEDAAFGHLPEHEKEILKRQLDAPKVKISFFGLYRYASKFDLLIIAISALCAIVAGAAMPLFTILFGSLTLAFQGIEQQTITYDRFIHELDKNVLYFVYLGIAEFATVYISMVGFIYTGGQVTQKIRENYLKAILRQNIAYFDQLGAGELTTRITSDTNLIQDGVSQKVGLTLTALATFVTAFIVAYVKYARLAGICTSTIVALTLVMGIGSQFIIKYSKLSLNHYGAGDTVAEEVISSIRIATAFGTQEKLAKQYDSHLSLGEKYGIRLQISLSLILGPMFAIMFWNYGLGLWMGSRYLVAHQVNAGQVLTVLMAILIGSFSLGNVSPNAQAFTSAIAAATKIFNTIDRISPIDPTSNEEGLILDHVEGNIELRNVKHIYPSRPDVTVMHDMSLSIPAGKVTALVGPSGSSKSTVMDLIERFYLPVGGTILLDGHDTQTLNLRWLRQQISLVSQEPVLFGTTIYNNIRHGLIGSIFENESEEKVHELVQNAARIANAHGFISALPNGYDTSVGERGFLLSGGQKQRIAIARAVVSEPKILLLDEATSALDTKSEGVVQAAIDRASKGRTTIVIAHRLSTIKTAHNIVVLLNGRIVEQGVHDNLIQMDGPYSKLVEAQRIREENTTDRREDHEDDYDSEGSTRTKDIVQINSINSGSISRRDEAGAGIFEKEVRQIDSRKSATGDIFATGDPDSERKYSLWTLIKFIASFNKEEWRWLIVGLMFSCLAGGGQPVQAYLFAKAISTLSLPESMYDKLRHDANFWSLIFFVIGIVQFITFGTHGLAFGICSERLVSRSRSKAFRMILRQDISFFDRDENTTGALTSFLSTETKYLAGISGQNLGMILMTSTTLIAAMCISLAFGWKLALVCISTLPILLGCGFYQFYMLAAFAQKSKTGNQDSASYACEATSAIRTVAALTRERDVWTSYHDILQAQSRANIISVLKSSILYAASQALVFFCVALGFWYGGSLLGRGEYNTFQFFVAFSEILFGAQSAGAVFSFAPDIGKAKNAAFELRKLFDLRPKIDTWSTEGEILNREKEHVKGAIEFKDVHFNYPTRPSQPVLRGLNLSVQPGQYIALVGPSGCGKSTTIALLERFYNVSSGEILIDGKNITDVNINSYRSYFSLVSQEPTLYQGTIKDNIMLGIDHTDVSEDEIIQVCKDANIYDFIMSLPTGFESIIGTKGIMLSGGQKQRVAIARALLRNPRILLLDEATSALDSQSEKIVQNALDAAARGRTTIAVAHRLSTIQKADMIYVFDQGQIIEQGTHHELLRQKGHYYELVNLQSLGKAH
ncbi:ABC multidrug transporter mdr1 [Penicillium odoratum]|uniref:ABC multidrug transporter mdr1 n=1 Tax=Penicillium odoratum TaxID=1167516 RepID=UPI002546A90D|nr:ABC multidrug transporter mdr1 [Penicillium odoratum]KAJ5746120.1 ABC multidrug transporter mdr1 [Penicillium odoratum]